MRVKFALVLMVALGLLGSSLSAAFADEDDDVGDPQAVFPLDSYRPSAADNVVLQWNEEALQCIRTSRPGPPIVARALFIVHASVYDAWTSYDARAVPTIRTGWSRRPSSERTLANKSRALSHAAHRALTNVFPVCSADFNQQLTALGYTTGDTSAAATVGRRAADNIINDRRNDGANQYAGYADTTGYRPVNTPETVNDPWRWQPLGAPHGLAAPQRPLAPHWGRVRPFNPEMLQTVQVPAPARDLDKLDLDGFLEIQANLNDTTKSIAEYWADGPASETPPGHWNLIAAWVSRRYGQSIDADARMFFGLNAALMDAGIACWNVKYRYDYVRPATAVRYWMRGQMITSWRLGGPGRDGIDTFPGEQWRPYQAANFVTPPFPEYFSGHSSFSAAAAAFMKDFGALQGRDGDILNASATIAPGTSFVEPGITPAAPVTLSWHRFADAADEAGVSRLYGGIHFNEGDQYARDSGKKLGEGAFSLAKKLWEGG